MGPVLPEHRWLNIGLICRPFLVFIASFENELVPVVLNSRLHIWPICHLLLLLLGTVLQ